jgi:hypothetical protein
MVAFDLDLSSHPEKPTYFLPIYLMAVLASSEVDGSVMIKIAIKQNEFNENQMEESVYREETCSAKLQTVSKTYNATLQKTRNSY